MCDGGVISIPLITAIVGAGVAVHGAREQKKATQAMLNQQQSEIDAAAVVKKQQRMEEARALRATARASAAEAAIGGNSLAMLEEDIMGQAGRDLALIETNRRNGTLASAAEASARIRVANAEALGTAGSGFVSGAGSAYNNYTIKRGRTG